MTTEWLISRISGVGWGWGGGGGGGGREPENTFIVPYTNSFLRAWLAIHVARSKVTLLFCLWLKKKTNKKAVREMAQTSSVLSVQDKMENQQTNWWHRSSYTERCKEKIQSMCVCVCVWECVRVRVCLCVWVVLNTVLIILRNILTFLLIHADI